MATEAGCDERMVILLREDDNRVIDALFADAAATVVPSR